MKRVIRLADCAHLPCNGEGYKPESMATARAALVKRALRLNNATGIIRDNTGELERYSHPSEHMRRESLEHVMDADFRRYIRNGASRIERGFEP